MHLTATESCGSQKPKWVRAGSKRQIGGGELHSAPKTPDLRP